MKMDDKEYMEFYGVEMTEKLAKLFTILNNSDKEELSKNECRKIIGICTTIEKINTAICNKAYDAYINQ